jgi:hypothetical protein
LVDSQSRVLEALASGEGFEAGPEPGARRL